MQWVGETQPTSIMMISGAETGKLTLVIENVGEVLHEIRSPLFMAAKEVKAEIMDSEGGWSLNPRERIYSNSNLRLDTARCFIFNWRVL